MDPVAAVATAALVLTAFAGGMTWIVRRGEAADVRQTTNVRRLFDRIDVMDEKNDQQHAQAARERHAMQVDLVTRIGAVDNKVSRIEGQLDVIHRNQPKQGEPRS